MWAGSENVMKSTALYLDKRGFPTAAPITLDANTTGKSWVLSAQLPVGTVTVRLELLCENTPHIVRVQQVQYGKEDCQFTPQNAAAAHHGDLFVNGHPCYRVKLPTDKRLSADKRRGLTFLFEALPLTQEETIEALVSAIEYAAALTREKDTDYARLRSEFDSIYNSNAWRAVRVYYRCKDVGKGILQAPRQIFAQSSRWLYRHLPLPAKMKERLKRHMLDNVGAFSGLSLSRPLRHTASELKEARNCFRPWARSPLQAHPVGTTTFTIGVHLHLFYLDMAPLFRKRLADIPFPFDLYISVSGQPEIIREQFAALPMVHKLVVETVPNQGRDVAPFLVTFGPQLAAYDLILHLHSKRSEHHEAGNDWREQLLDTLLKDMAQIRQWVGLFTANPELGLLYLETNPVFPYWTLTTYTNEADLRGLLERLSIPYPETGVYLDFPVGTMFWARGAALHPLLTAALTYADFPPEEGQLDSTLSHAVERSLCLVAEHQGYLPAQVSNNEVVLGRGMQNLDAYLATDAIQMTQYAFRFKYHVFDVFDTLVYSRYSTPPALFKIVEQVAAERGLGQFPFAVLRQSAQTAVGKRRRGYDIHEIYTELCYQGTLDADLGEKLKQLEFELLLASCRPRRPIADLFQTLKNPVIACDTVWPEEYLRIILTACRVPVESSKKFYLSNNLGYGKADGRMYHYLKGCFRGQPYLNIGSHEQHDVAVPNAHQIHAFHVMSLENMCQIAGLIQAAEKGWISPAHIAHYRDRMGEDPFSLAEVMTEMMVENTAVHYKS